MSKKTKKQEAPAMAPATPMRSMQEIQAEYEQVVARLGEDHYRHRVLEAEMQQLTARL